MNKNHLCAVVAICGLAVCEAATVTVSTVAELATAISQATAGDTIQLAAGTYDVASCVANNWYNLYLGGKSLTIEGADATSWRENTSRETKTIITAGGTLSRHLIGFSTGAQLTLRHLTFKGVTSTQVGGIVCRNGGGELCVTNCVFSENKGPSIAVIQSSGLVSDCLFHKNAATVSYGGAVSGCEIHNCVFDGNTAAQLGGAVVGSKVYDSVFTGNSSRRQGGAVYVNSGSAVYSNCTFTSCTTTAEHGRGGAVCQEGGDLQLIDCTFDGCVANGGYTADGYRAGGAICLTGGTNEVLGCTFQNCTAPTKGGGIYARGGRLTVKGSAFVGNTASNSNGGGICCEASVGDVKVEGCSFTSNTSGMQGGAAYVNGGTSVYSNCTFTMCKTTAQHGLGGAFCQVGGILELKACAFDGCIANGGYTMDGYRAGGAICMRGGTNVVSGCAFKNCTAPTKGGAIYAKGSGSLTVKDSTFVGNQANGSNGGGICCETDQRDTRVEGCTFSANRSAGTGGAISDCDGIVACSFANNTNAYFGGHCWNCTIRRSQITGYGSIGQSKIYDSVFDGARTDDSDNWNRGLLMSTGASSGSMSAFNCLFVNCACMHLAESYGNQVKLVNCTMADCSPKSYVFLANANGTASPAIEVDNCIFSGNVRTGKRFGLDVYFVPGVGGDLTIQNCVAETANIPSPSSAITVTTSDLTVSRVRFCGEKASINAAPYTPRYTNRAVIDGGLNLDWTDGDLDLAGNPRMRNGRVDIGCYEAWYDKPGFAMMLR